MTTIGENLPLQYPCVDSTLYSFPFATFHHKDLSVAIGTAAKGSSTSSSRPSRGAGESLQRVGRGLGGRREASSRRAGGTGLAGRLPVERCASRYRTLVDYPVFGGLLQVLGWAAEQQVPRVRLSGARPRKDSFGD